MTSPLDLGELERLATAAEAMTEVVGREGAGEVDLAPKSCRSRAVIVAAKLGDIDVTLATDRDALPVMVIRPSTVLSLIEEVKRLREVVKPFVAPHWTDEAPDDPAPHELTDDDVIDITVPFGALRKARAALPAPPAGGSE